MKNKVSFIHCADLHLGMPFTGMGNGSCSQQRRRDLKEAFERIISLVQEKNADYLVISGDLYEHHYVTSATIHWLNTQFKKLGNKPCILIPGNHDPYVFNSWYRSYPWNSNVHILTTNFPEFVDAQNGAYFYGIGFDTFRQEQLPLIALPQIVPSQINVCLFHGTLDMAFTQNAYNPIDSKTLLEMGFDYYALGHFHGKNEALAAEGVINAGSPEPLGFDEQGEHGVYWVCVEKKEEQVQRRVQFLPIQKRFYREMEIDITGVESGQQLQSKLLGLMEGCNTPNDIIKIKVSGRTSSELPIDAKTQEEFLRELCFHVEIVDATRPDYKLDELAVENNITGVFTRMMQQKITKATEAEKEMLEKALYLGLDAIFHGNVELL